MQPNVINSDFSNRQTPARRTMVWLVVIVVVILLIGGLFIITKRVKAKPNPKTTADLVLSAFSNCDSTSAKKNFPSLPDSTASFLKKSCHPGDSSYKYQGQETNTVSSTKTKDQTSVDQTVSTLNYIYTTKGVNRTVSVKLIWSDKQKTWLVSDISHNASGN